MKPARTGRRGTRAARNGIWGLAGAALLGLAATPALSAQFIGVAWDSLNSPVYRFDDAGGPVTLVGYSGFPGLNSLASAPGERFYSLATYPDHSLLVEVDLNTGVAAPVVPVSVIGIRGLAITTDGTFYGTLGSGRLIEIDPLSGAARTVLQTPFTAMQGLTAWPGGLLYSWDIVAGLVMIDPVAGLAADVNPQVGGFSDIQSLALDSGGLLLGGRNGLYHIDVNTGVATAIGAVGPLDLRGIELAPEPGTLLFALAGTAGLLLRRWRS